MSADSNFLIVVVGLLCAAYVTVRDRSAKAWRETAEANEGMLKAKEQALAEREVQINGQEKEIGYLRGKIETLEHRMTDLAGRPLAIEKVADALQKLITRQEQMSGEFNQRHDDLERMYQNGHRETVEAIRAVESAVRENGGTTR